MINGICVVVCDILFVVYLSSFGTIYPDIQVCTELIYIYERCMLSNLNFVLSLLSEHPLCR